MKRLILIICVIVATSVANATNRGFMPGDAFWHTMLTADGIRAWKSAEHPQIGYARPKIEEMAMCGYAGYWALRLPPNSSSLIENLSKVYNHLRENHEFRRLVEYPQAGGDVVQRETNGFHLFVYNEGFDLKRHRIGLRYNETWVEDESAFGPHPRSTRLELFVNDRAAFSRDWRDSTIVPRLRTKCPPIPDQEERQRRRVGSESISEPVLIDGPIKVVVTVKTNLTPYVQRRNGAKFFVVSDQKIQAYTAKQGSWVVEDWEPEPEP